MAVLKIGFKAPDFCLPDSFGKNFCLKDFLGKWVVLYFYPKDNTPGCTIQAIDFTKELKEFEKLNAVVFGISPDSMKSHCGFIESQNLKVSLLSDELKIVLKKYGAWGKKTMYGKEYFGVIRSTFLIKPDGKIAFIWQKVKVEGHISKVMEKLVENCGK